MKNKKMFIGLIILITVGIIFITATIFFSINNNRSIKGLFNKLEKAINGIHEDEIEECYPDFMREYIPTISRNKIKEFHNKVGNISFEIVHQNKCDYDEYVLIEQQQEINEEYNCKIKLEDYQIITCKYHEGFGETTFEIIKINGRWYLYYCSYLSEPLSYFVE